MHRVSWTLLFCLMASAALAQGDRTARVVAKIGPRTLTVGDLETLISQRSHLSRQALSDEKRLVTWINDEVEALVLAEGAIKRGLDREPATLQTYNKSLVQMFVRKEVDNKINVDTIEDAEVKAYFETHRDNYEQPEQRRASHIVVDNKDKAIELIKEARGTKPNDFVQLARTHSLDQETRLRGGDLLFFTKEGRVFGGSGAPIDSSLVNVAFALTHAGEVAAEPIDLGNGKFSVLRLVDIREASRRSLADSKVAIVRMLVRQKRQAALEQRMGELKKAAKVETFDRLLDDIVLPKPPPAPPRTGH